MKTPAVLEKVRDLIRVIVRYVGWLGPLAVRIFLGYSFAADGWGKLHNLEEVTGFFVEWGVPMPHFNAALTGGVEFVGGWLLVFGFLTRFAAVPLMIVMIVATMKAKWPKHESWTDLFNYEEVIDATVFAWLACAGAGKASLDYLIGKKLGILVEPDKQT